MYPGDESSQGALLQIPVCYEVPSIAVIDLQFSVFTMDDTVSAFLRHISSANKTASALVWAWPEALHA